MTEDRSEKIENCVRIMFWFIVVLLSFPATTSAQREKDRYDVAILGGRVMDPDRGLDMVTNVGIIGKSVRTLTQEPISGTTVIDARGLVVAPGFIDLLSYDPVESGVWNKIADGVTTALAMHGGAAFPARWYSVMEKRRPPINYGASFFYTEARRQFQQNIYAPVADRDIPRLVAIAEQALRGGCLGISFSLEYVPGITRDEIIPLMHLAARFDVPVFFHVRYSDMEEPGTNIEALSEVLGYARETGAAIHVDHINSTGGTFSMSKSITMLDSARAEGIDVTACLYPYTFWGTYLNSARFDRGWQQRFRISYGDLQLAGSRERLTPESFAKYRRHGKLAVAYAIPEEDIRIALRAPYIMIGSDAILEQGFNNHPRASGTFSRTIAVYSREQRTLTLMEALAKMTILPARRMERASPSIKKKGRLSIGADADIVIFDPERIRDRSTVEHPEYSSSGISYVLVAGKVALDPTGPLKESRSGGSIRRGQ